MNNTMEMHDSFLRELSWNGDGRGHVLFHAVIHRSESRIFGANAHESGWQELRFDFEGMRLEGTVDLAEKPYASEGELWANGKNGNGVIHLPANHVGDICLEMRLSPLFEIVKIRASAVRTQLMGEFKLEATWNADGERTQANA